MKMFLLAAVLCVLGMTAAYPTGPPLSACNDQSPHHGPWRAQNGTSPYIISFSKSSVAPGETVDVTISAQNDFFRGFMIQGRLGSRLVGTFEAGDETQTMDCPGGERNTAAHVNKNDKTSVTMAWTAPADLAAGDVVFRASIVKTFSVFWNDQTASLSVAA